ncbi:uncharacterized protein LOC125239408 [Leguminivora glycinivorella]|uniref:uncharacterized protein LOC125239408 n=1 Tax=Leguminivora glycinivorella TaxID=1035111 RepID=UPI002010376E|nr:uncharacterized protein LOC125239408 [Leguminivora glycinivorella]
MNSVKKNNNAKKSTKTKKIKPFKCDLCPKRCSNKWDLVHHRYSHSDETPYKCPHCDYAGKSKKYLGRHIRNRHVRNKTVECGVCGMTFLYESQLKKHMYVHTGEKPYKCETCEKAFNSAYSLRTHKLIHANLKPFKCTYCPYACRDSSTLRKHKDGHLGKVHHYNCSICNASYGKRAALKVHIAEQHFNIDMKIMECDACGQKFKHRRGLVIHIQTIHEKTRSAKCDLCGVVLSNRANMRAHLRAHEDRRPYRCAFKGCGKRFKDASGRTKHEIKHYPERQFPCKICDRLFTREHRMQKHLTTHMAKVKKVECNYCGVRFYNKNYLTTHIERMHGRKKQKYVCDLCGLVTTNKPSIVMHLKYGHDPDKLKEIVCDICDQTFKSDFNLKLHYWRRHKVDYIIPRKYPRKKKLKKTIEVEVKEEPIDDNYEVETYFTVTTKLEPVDEEEEKLTEPVPELTEPVPELTEPVPELTEPVPELTEPVPELTEPVPEPETRVQLENNLASDVFEEFITPIMKNREDRKPVYTRQAFVDKRSEMRIRKKIDRLMKQRIKNEIERAKQLRKKREERARKLASRKLERTRRKYNRLIQNAIKNSMKKDKVKIKHGAISAQEQQPDSLLEANFFIKQTIDNRDRVVDEPLDIEKRRKDIYEIMRRNNSLVHENNGINDEEEMVNMEGNEINHNEDVDIDEQSINNNDTGTDAVEKDITRKSGRNRKLNPKYFDDESCEDKREKIDIKKVENKNRKLKFNTHQCYVCFKLYETKEELLDHCKEHFNLCEMQTIKKCPLCDYSTNLNITRHLKLKHNVKIDVRYGTFKEQENGNKYYYEVNDDRIKQLEIIPSLKRLNRREYCKIDKRNREKKNKEVLKSKLVKKGKEWIVMKEKIKINYKDCLLPNIDKVESINVKGSYVDRLKELYKVAKKNGKTMVFPCDSCDKICQTLAALKLHSRKHEAHPKPFKKKVWKHKLEGKNVKKVNRVANIDNRMAQPQPVANKHRCDKELIEFYEQNIKGSDVEFWQFLKIYNKMERENVNDFEDLQKTTQFGLHFNEPVDNSEPKDLNGDLREENSINNRNQTVKKKVNNKVKNAFTRVVRLSKREAKQREEARRRLREKINFNS